MKFYFSLIGDWQSGIGLAAQQYQQWHSFLISCTATLEATMWLNMALELTDSKKNKDEESCALSL